MKKLIAIVIVVFATMNLTTAQPEGNFIELEEGGTRSPLEEQRIGFLQQDNSVLSIRRVRINDIRSYLNGTQLRLIHPIKQTPLSFKADHVTDRGGGDYYWTGYSSQGAISISKQGGNYSGYIDLPGENEYILLMSLDTLKPYLIFIKPERAKQSAECGGTMVDPNDPLDPIYADDYVEERCSEPNVRLLFLVADNADNILNARDVANMITNELNGACQASNANATFVLAGVDRIPDGAFNQMVASDDPIGDDGAQLLNLWIFNNLREQYRADLTVVLVRQPYLPPGGGQIFGAAARIPANGNDNNYCLVSIVDAAVNFTTSHELAHLLGARHQRCATCPVGGCDDMTRFHGFLVGAANQTILAQRGCGLVRIARFSDRDALFNLQPTGDNQNRNSDIIERCARRASCFKLGGGRPIGGDPINVIPVSIAGPRHLSDCQQNAIWVSDVGVGFQGPVTFRWQISLNGLDNWQDVSTVQNYETNNATTLPDSFVLRLTVQDGMGNFGQVSILVFRDIIC